MLAASQTDSQGRTFWRPAVLNAHGGIPIGFAHGPSGVALFLAYLGQLTGNPLYLEAAETSAQHDFDSGFEKKAWGKDLNDGMVLPYLCQGTSGIGMVCLRLAKLTGKNIWLERAESLSQHAISRIAYLSSLFNGIAGLGAFQDDLHCCTGNDHYRRAAWAIAESVLLYATKEESGKIRFPGRMNLRLSDDYAHGTAGMMEFLSNLTATNKYRPLFDIR